MFPNKVKFTKGDFFYEMTTEIAFKFSYLRKIICKQWKLEEAYNEAAQVKHLLKTPVVFEVEDLDLFDLVDVC